MRCMTMHRRRCSGFPRPVPRSTRTFPQVNASGTPPPAPCPCTRTARHAYPQPKSLSHLPAETHAMMVVCVEQFVRAGVGAHATPKPCTPRRGSRLSPSRRREPLNGERGRSDTATASESFGSQRGHRETPYRIPVRGSESRGQRYSESAVVAMARTVVTVSPPCVGYLGAARRG